MGNAQEVERPGLVIVIGAWAPEPEQSCLLWVKGQTETGKPLRKHLRYRMGGQPFRVGLSPTELHWGIPSSTSSSRPSRLGPAHEVDVTRRRRRRNATTSPSTPRAALGRSPARPRAEVVRASPVNPADRRPLRRPSLAPKGCGNVVPSRCQRTRTLPTWMQRWNAPESDFAVDRTNLRSISSPSCGQRWLKQG